MMLKPKSFSFMLVILVGGFFLSAVLGWLRFPEESRRWQIAKPPLERADVDAVPLFEDDSVFHDSWFHGIFRVADSEAGPAWGQHPMIRLGLCEICWVPRPDATRATRRTALFVVSLCI